MKTKKTLTIAAFILALMMVCPSGYAGELDDSTQASEPVSSSSSDGWEFRVTPYLWMVGLDGSLTAKGQEADVDVEFWDLLDDVDFAAQARFEAWKGRWGLYLDGTYIKLSMDGGFGPIDADVGVEMAGVGIGALYRVLDKPIGVDGQRKLELDMFVGGRWNYLKNEIELKGAGPLGADLDFDADVDWFDPGFGPRLTVGLTDKLLGRVLGGIGGFGLEDSADFAWFFEADLGYHLKENMILWVGYHILDIDYDEGSGADKFVFDIQESGMQVGLEFRF